MRLLFVTLLVTISPLAVAQQPVAEDLDEILRGWQVAKQKLKTFDCAVERLSRDNALDVRDTYKGRLRFMKIDDKADGIKFRLNLDKVGNQQVYEKFVCTGKELHVYDPSKKIVQKLAAGKVAPFFDDQGALLGLGGEDLSKRCQLTLLRPDPPDRFYHYILVRPKNGQQVGEFTEARISLLRSNHMPAQVWLVQPNRTEVTWNLSAWKINVDIPAETFIPEVPEGWKVVPVQPPALPRRMP
jgi:TIGR03009 family protein